jgi:hypothetical protein
MVPVVLAVMVVRTILQVLVDHQERVALLDRLAEPAVTEQMARRVVQVEQVVMELMVLPVVQVEQVVMEQLAALAAQVEQVVSRSKLTLFQDLSLS